MNLQDGEVQRDGNERLFAAREQRDRLERLARRLDLDLDAAGEHVVLVLELERGLAAAGDDHGLTSEKSHTKSFQIATGKPADCAHPNKRAKS